MGGATGVTDHRTARKASGAPTGGFRAFQRVTIAVWACQPSGLSRRVQNSLGSAVPFSTKTPILSSYRV